MVRIRTCWLVRFGILLLLPSFGLSGCGSKRGSVSGKVTWKGETLPSGLVIFVDKDGFVSPPAGIEVDGSYEAHDVPVGRVTVCVEVLPLSGGDQSLNDAKNRSKKPIDIQILSKFRDAKQALKYRDAKQSDLTFDVRPGPNVYNVELQ
jgi:hypothetical protein